MTFYKCPKCSKMSVQEYRDDYISGPVVCSKSNQKALVHRVKHGCRCRLGCGYDKSVISLVDSHGHRVA